MPLSFNPVGQPGDSVWPFRKNNSNRILVSTSGLTLQTFNMNLSFHYLPIILLYFAISNYKRQLEFSDCT